MDDLEALLERQRQLQQQLAERAGALDQALVLDHHQARERGAGGKVAAAEGRAVHDAALHRIEGRVEHRAAREQRADRHVAA